MPVGERHAYETRYKNVIPNNVRRTHIAQKCLRNYIPSILKTYDSSILEKVNTHSFKGFTNYIKQKMINSYDKICTDIDCYVCNLSAAIMPKFLK